MKTCINASLRRYAISPNKMMGQNFLVSRVALNKIIAAAELSKSDTVLEVGPGLGVLTVELAKYAGRVIAVEKDKELAAALKKILTEQNIKNVKIIMGDILKLIDTHSVIPAHPPAGGGNPDLSEKNWIPAQGGRNDKKASLSIQNNYKLVANIPYYLTSHLIRQFLESANPPKEMILMVQKEVAQRICAKPPRMSLLAAATQFYAQTEIIATVPKKSFCPAPKVDSAIIRLKPYDNISKFRHIEISKYFAFLHAGFSQPRKQLAGNLSKKLNIPREKIITALSATGIKPEQRAESLSVEEWIKVTENF